ncbi:sigma-70 family RNA polymerase sigma factor [Nocardioides sp. NPDC006273]|uniref:sigma-70 family RNA polymerase sigma factor n=1 Tax=Nocardioides sp. NPDC006273 TaxID=3155598 RepID=UPI0033B0B667
MIAEFQSQRPRLLAIAYRLLGSMADAEDIVQDAFVRWQRVDRTVIDSPAAWLTRVTTNLALNLLDSAERRHREPAAALPEPVVTEGGPLGPLESVAARESISFGVLVLMERLPSAERAVFVLHQAFGYSHREIAELLGSTEEASRQRLRRARGRLRDGDGRRSEPADPEHVRRLSESFLRAAQAGDMEQLHLVLSADVTSIADGGGAVGTARFPIVGVDKVARYWAGLGRRPESVVVVFMPVELNGTPALIVSMDGAPIAAVLFAVTDRIDSIWLIVDPEKLRRLPATA